MYYKVTTPAIFFDGGLNDNSTDVNFRGDFLILSRYDRREDYVFNLADNVTGILILDDTTQITNIESVLYYGGSGNDHITTLDDNFNDALSGGSGNDFLSAGGGSDGLNGGDGDDYLDGGQGEFSDTLYGGNGNDTLHGGSGDDYLLGNGDPGNQIDTDIIHGGDGNDYIDGGMGGDSLFGGAGNDTILDAIDEFVNTFVNTLDGGAGDDLLQGNGVLIGGEGNDVLISFGNDALNGGIGRDSLYGYDGNDYLISEDTDTLVSGWSGIDFASIDRSTLTNDFVFDISSQDFVGNPDDVDDVVILVDQTEVSGIERVEFRAGSGNDILTGGALNDTLVGNNGDDNLTGGAGDDVLDGGAGANSLMGGAGNDTLMGSEGSNTTAIFSGARNNYLITQLLDGRISIADQRGGSPDGTDIASNIQFLQFSDGPYSVTSVVNTAPQILSSVGAPPLVEDSHALNLTGSGTIRFDDANLNDSHTLNVTPAATNTLGGIMTATISDPATDAGDGAVTWTYTLANSAAQYLGDGQSVEEKFNVEIDDGHGGTVVQEVSITIQGTNDAALINGTVTSLATEDNASVVNGVLTVSDIDAGENSFQPQTGLARTYGTFSVDASGAWSYALNNAANNVQALVAGQMVTDTFDVVSEDGTASQAVTITISGTNDSAVITGTASGSASEDSVTTVSDALTITDVDTGENEFQPQTDASGTYGSFSISSVGAWSCSLNNSAANVQALGSGQNVTDSFSVLSKDGTSELVTITITGADEPNSPPVITSNDGGESTAVSVDENSSLVTDVDATDADLPAQTLGYSIVGGADGSLFQINAVSGVLDFKNAPNFENKLDANLDNVYEVIVKVADSNGGSDTQTINVTVSDVDEFNVSPVVDVDAAVNTVAENSMVGTVVGIAASAIDADGSNNSVAYSLADDAGGRFAIDSTTGVVIVAAALDREASATHDIIIRATSSDESVSTETFTIAVTDVDEFNVDGLADTDASANAVAENSANGTTVGFTLVAADADATNNSITYSLTNNTDGRFAIDPLTGVVTVANGALLNRETAASYIIAALATSADGSSAAQNVTINLNDVDEFDVSAVADNHVAANTVAENSAVGTVVGITALASDADATTNAVTYALDINAGGRFAINATSGVISVAGALDYETAISHNVTVRATSADTSFSTMVLAVNVTDVNEGGGVINGTPLADNLIGTNADDIINGLGSNDVLTGNGGNDMLNGGTGGDTMRGGNGDDIYIVDSYFDQVIELSGQGSDTVRTSLPLYILGSEVENLEFTGTSVFSGTGNGSANRIVGGNNSDLLVGLGGADTLVGAGGADALNGGAANDRLLGGIGNDDLTGGTGADQFIFDTVLGTSNVDRVRDFSISVGDLVVLDNDVFIGLTGLGTLQANEFRQRSGNGTANTQGQDADDRIVFNTTTKGLYYDADGVSGVTSIQFATLDLVSSLVPNGIQIVE